MRMNGVHLHDLGELLSSEELRRGNAVRDAERLSLKRPTKDWATLGSSWSRLDLLNGSIVDRLDGAVTHPAY